MVSQSCKYALRAASYLASQQLRKPVNVQQIAKGIDAPMAFTGKLLQALQKQGIVSSLKGPYGGFFVNEEQLAFPIIAIVKAIDGEGIFYECGFGLKNCSDAKPCPLHEKYAVLRNEMKKTFSETLLRDLGMLKNNRLVYLS